MDWDPDRDWDFSSIEDLPDRIREMMDDLYGSSTKLSITAERPPNRSRKTRDIHGSVHVEDEHIIVIADLTGHPSETIQLRSDGNSLWISTTEDRTEFENRFELPTAVDVDRGDAVYNNGIVKVDFPRINGAD